MKLIRLVLRVLLTPTFAGHRGFQCEAEPLPREYHDHDEERKTAVEQLMLSAERSVDRPRITLAEDSLIQLLTLDSWTH